MDAAASTATMATPVVVTVGNPNTGKSTLFNQLTGLRQKVSNYSGVTVEQVSGHCDLGGIAVRLVDVPGTYSLAAMSPDEIVTVDVLRGAVANLGMPDAVIVVVDATNLRRNLFLASQILEAGVPTVIALNMIDRLALEGIEIDQGELSRRLDCPVVPLSATQGTGLAELKQAVVGVLEKSAPPDIMINPMLGNAALELAGNVSSASHHVSALEASRALVDEGGYAEARLVEIGGNATVERLKALRHQVGGGRNLATLEARDRYSWIHAQLTGVEHRSAGAIRPIAEFVDRIVNDPVSGTLLFVLVMATVFQAVFACAGPLVDAINVLTGSLAEITAAIPGGGLFARFISEGVVAGVGSVVVFLPQIVILFAFIIVLEDSGYMARAAFLMDRLMRGMGLSGQSFIPMLSSFACAVPGIMGTRVIANKHDRLATILAAPFMTCSARLPVYSLLITAFIPDTRYLGGLVNQRGLILLGLYALGIVGGAMTAWLVSRVFWSRKKSRFLLEMPPYRIPNARAVLSKLLARALIFLKRAGTIIFAVAIIVWVLASFPLHTGPHSPAGGAVVAAQQLEQSYLGQISRGVAPLFAPLGWDWKVTAAVVASFPAREVVIAVLGTIYAVGDDSEAASLSSRIQSARHADGSLVYTLPMVLGLMIFFAFCLQCASTMAVMRRETGTWAWPTAAWVYMTGLGYLGALFAYQFGTWLELG